MVLFLSTQMYLKPNIHEYLTPAMEIVSVDPNCIYNSPLSVQSIDSDYTSSEEDGGGGGGEDDDDDSDSMTSATSSAESESAFADGVGIVQIEKPNEVHHLLNAKTAVALPQNKTLNGKGFLYKYFAYKILNFYFIF